MSGGSGQGSPLRFLRVASKCADMQEFEAVFTRICDGERIFVPTKKPPAPGGRVRFRMLLQSGEVAFEGEGEILSSSAADSGVPGMNVRLLSLDATNQEFVDRVVRREGSGSLPLPAPEQSAVYQRHPGSPVPVPVTAPPAKGGGRRPAKTLLGLPVDAVKPATGEEGDGAAPHEQRAKGSDIIVPANPFSEVTDELLEVFVDCTLYEENLADSEEQLWDEHTDITEPPGEPPMGAREDDSVPRLARSLAGAGQATALGGVDDDGDEPTQTRPAAFHTSSGANLAALAATQIAQSADPEFQRLIDSSGGAATSNPPASAVGSPFAAPPMERAPTSVNLKPRNRLAAVVIGVALGAALIGGLVGYVLRGGGDESASVLADAAAPAAIDGGVKQAVRVVDLADAGSAVKAVENPPDAATADDAEPCRARFESTPAGATVVVGDKELGVTPGEADIECGSATLEFRAEGHTPQTVEVEAAPGSPAVVSVVLEAKEKQAPDRQMRTLRVFTNPRRAAVFVNGERVGLSPVRTKVAADEVAEVKIIKRGYRVLKRSIRAKKKVNTLRLRLRKR